MPKRKRIDGSGARGPSDVLTGRARVTLGELLDLIHRVNPTGHDLGPRDAEQRYALKSRLQSLLVRRFGASLDVIADPEREGTVSIVCRGQGRDGCHAVIAALDEEATPSALMRHADDAIEAYDYEQARRDLERALASSGVRPPDV